MSVLRPHPLATAKIKTVEYFTNLTYSFGVACFSVRGHCCFGSQRACLLGDRIRQASVHVLHRCVCAACRPCHCTSPFALMIFDAVSVCLDLALKSAGGIRCERASAYLRQELQVREVYQLRGGIHRYIDEFGNGSTSTQCGKDATAVDQGLFVGKNFVFDRRLAISDSHTVDERKPQALESGTALQCSAKVHTNGPGPCSNAASDGSPAAAPPHYTVVGQCSNCAQPWDQYDMQWTCSRCQAVVLLCNGCAAQRRRELSVQRRLPAGHASAATLQPLVCSLCVHLELHPAKVALAASKSQGKGPRALVKSV